MKKIIGSFLKGGIKGIPVVGNLITEFKAQKADPATGEGKNDWPRIIGYYVMVIIALCLLAKGLISEDAFDKVL